METLITNILFHSNPSPIIIIQADHGPGAYLDWNSVEKTNLDERMSIINAYYFPGDHNSLLYVSITPVNSFRVLFDEYFGMNYPLIEDRSYFSFLNNPFDFTKVTSKLKNSLNFLINTTIVRISVSLPISRLLTRARSLR